jgi:3-dehydroquinate dehydratase-2
MKKLLVINGPNINMLGIREPDLYGNETYANLLKFIKQICERENIEAECFQSNHEGAIIDEIQNAYGKFDGIVINPAAYTHTSVAVYDALKAVGLPAVEVHLTDIHKRAEQTGEEFRRISYVSRACEKTFAGLGFEGYEKAIRYLVTKNNQQT